MKHLFLAVFIMFSLVSVTSCKKNDGNCNNAAYSGPMQVIKDCTGTYLRYQQKDYMVCNSAILSAYGSGSWVIAGFNLTTYCPTMPIVICNMYHAYEGVANVICIQSPVVVD